MIPKIIHYIWLGKRPMHPLMVSWRQEWQRLHPSWIIMVWTEGSNLDELVCGDLIVKSRNLQSLSDSCHLSQRANIWRYEIMEKFGGMYLDTDFEPIKCIDPIIEDKIAFAGKAKVKYNHLTDRIACGLFGAPANHPWLQDLAKNITSKDPRTDGSLGIGYFTEITSQHPEVHLFEPVVFYSWRWDEPGKYPPPSSAGAYAVHRWSSKWYPHGFRPL